MAKKRTTTETTTPAITDTPLRLEWRSPSELAENPANWRRHPEAQVNALTDVLSEVGWAGACLYNERTQRLIDGHARRKVALSQGSEKVPVLVGNWTEEQEKKILATLDPLASMAEADKDRLDALLRDVHTGSEALQQMLTDLAEKSGVIPGMAKPTPGAGGDEFDASAAMEGECRVKPGELWLIRGNGIEHRLCCGDSTDPETIKRLMGDDRASLCFTSPPYAQQRDYGEKAKEKVQDWDGLMRGVFGNLSQVMTDDGQVLVNLGLVHRDGEWVPYWDGWIEWMRRQGWRRFGWYVWDQGPGMPGDWGGRLAPSFEFVWHFNRESLKPEKARECKHAGEAHGGKGQRGVNGEVKQRSHGQAPVQSHAIHDSVFRVNRQGAQHGADGHPAPYPIGFPSLAIESWPGSVFDPFGGSGTTLIAAARLGQRSFLCELEPKFAEIVLRRAEAEGLAVERAQG